MSASDRKAPLPRKAAKRADRRATYALEDSAAGPSRRSSRKASNRQRTDVKMNEKRRVSLSRPSSPGGKSGR